METSILSPSPLVPDVAPICPHFGICGGCTTQDISYGQQVLAKEKWLTSLFAPLTTGKTVELPFLASDRTYPTYFRNKTRFSFVIEEGILRAARHRLGEDEAEVAVNQCFIMSATSTAIALFTAAYGQENGWELFNPQTSHGWLKHLLIREGKQTGECLVSLVTTETNMEAADQWAKALLARFPSITSIYQSLTRGRNNFEPQDRLLAGQEAIHERIGDYVFKISPHAFFQTNSEIVPKLYEAIKEEVAKQKPKKLWDLYAGSASIGIYVHDKADSIISIESNPQNIADAQWNIQANRVSNLGIHAGTVEAVCTSSFITEQGKPDLILVDPPRAGLSQKSRDLIAGIKPQSILYVSCNPTTCFRDTQEFLRRGYGLSSLRGIDMYPHTMHCEMIAVLERK